MLIIKFNFKNFIKFINKIKLITLWVFVLFSVYLFQSCTSKRSCGGDTDIYCTIPDPPQNLRYEVSSNTTYTIFWDVTDESRAFNSEYLCYSSDLDLSTDSLVWTQDEVVKTGGSYTQKDWNDTTAIIDYIPKTKCNFRVRSCRNSGCSLPSNILEFYMGA